MEDQDLILRVLSGNVDAYRLLYARHKTTAWNLAMYICKNETLAKDVVQVSFTNAYKYLHTFQRSASFKTWLLRIVKNECYSTMKLENKYYGEDLLPVNEKWEDDWSIEHTLDEKDTKKWISNVLSKMKVNEALMLQLFYLQELKLKEIGEIVGCTEGSAKVVLHRARKSFRSIIEKTVN